MHLPGSETPELVDGRPSMRAAPRGRHGYLQGELPIGLRLAYPRLALGWWPLTQPDARLSQHRILRPDLAGCRNALTPELSDDGPIDLRPDWLCDIASPGNAHDDRPIKSKVYCEAGVPWFCLADPQERTLEVFELHAEGGRCRGAFGDSDVLALPPFNDAKLTIADLLGAKPKGQPAPQGRSPSGATNPQPKPTPG